MMSLFLDGSDKTFTIGIVKDEITLYSKTYDTQNNLAQSMFIYLDEALKEVNIDITEIEKIYCTNGPGSFTGIRIVLTFAKTLAWTLNIPIVLLSTLEFLATTETRKKYILSLIDARRGNVYGSLYSTKLKKIIKDKFVNYESLLEEVKLAVDFNEVEIVSNYDYEGSVKPTLNVSKIVCKHKKSKSINPHKSNPNYLKLTEAEEKLNDKKNK